MNVIVKKKAIFFPTFWENKIKKIWVGPFFRVGRG